MVDLKMDWLLTKFGCMRGYWPTTYLGLPLGVTLKQSLFGSRFLKRFGISFITRSMSLFRKVVDIV